LSSTGGKVPKTKNSSTKNNAKMNSTSGKKMAKTQKIPEFYAT
jgi:hypothetical protein